MLMIQTVSICAVHYLCTGFAKRPSDTVSASVLCPVQKQKLNLGFR